MRSEDLHEGYPIDPSIHGILEDCIIVPRVAGKTAPRLIQDLILYDQRRPPVGGQHILTEPPPHFSERKRDSFRQLTGNGCRHKYVTKPRQSDLPPIDHRPDSKSRYKVGAICSNCRAHVEIDVNFEKTKGNPCPNEDYPLHHFIHEWASSYRAEDTSAQSNLWKETQKFECSSPSCQANLTVRLKDPLLTPHDIRLLTDENLLRQRTKEAEESNPELFKEHTSLYIINVLNDLHLYILNCLKGYPGRTITKHNRRFMGAFGVDGDPFKHLLESLGFVKHTSEGPEDYKLWTSPVLESPVEPVLKDPFQIRLDDVDAELACLIQLRPTQEKRLPKLNPHTLQPTPHDIPRCLGAQGYQTVSSSRTIDLTADEHPHYASLGALADFSDDLISFAFLRQISCDPDNEPYYLSCLQDISEGRKSDTLRTEYAVQISQGKTSLSDLEEAYTSLGFDRDDKLLEDDNVIGVFQSRLSDAPRQEHSMRQSLALIGKDRKSDKITAFATRVTIETYEQALAYLGADDAVNDEFIVMMSALKKEEKPTDLEAVSKALEIIARHRNSEPLEAHLRSMAMDNDNGLMDIGEAYRTLDIQDRTTEDDMLLSIYSIRVEDTPARAPDYRKALRTIAREINSQKLSNFLTTGFYNTSSSQVSKDIPVGLENIGNTCYLNSLLQFYFTITPLRDMVLNFEDYKMEVTEERLREKRVGSRKVKGEEVRRAQKFVVELRKLFQSMISATSSSVTPDQEVALLTLVGSDKAETVRRQSMILGAKPGLGQGLGELNGMPLLGPIGPPPPLPAPPPPVPEHPDTNGFASQEMTDVKPSTITPVDGDNSSEATLVSQSGNDDLMTIDTETRSIQQKILGDKENLPPSKDVTDAPGHPTLDGILTDTSSSKLNEQSASPKKEGNGESDILLSPEDLPPNAPNRLPPPVPPRPMSQEKKNELSNQIQIGAQQDVGEVINNVLFQLQCAIKANSFDENGEQIDKVKELFFGKTRSYILTADDKERSQEEFFSDIKVNVVSGPKDIYAALDGAFDEQEVDVEGAKALQYASISKLPKILSIQVQRAQYNAETKSTYKSINHLELKETIYMDRYMDTHDIELMKRRRACWKWKDEMRILEARKEALTNPQFKTDAPTILDAARAFLMSLQESIDEDPIEIAPDVITTLETLAVESRKQLALIEGRCKELSTNISSQFTDLRQVPYRLQSAFFHRGSVSFGHYWIYIYDFARDKWRKYNDGYVTEVTDRNEIFEQEGNNPATPYFLVYVADEAMVEPVCRDIPEQTNEQQDVEMENLPTEVDEIAGTTYSGTGMKGRTLQDSIWAPKRAEEEMTWSFDAY